MNTSLRIGLWNANGLAQRRLEVEHYLNENKLDILLISETHFTQRNYFNISKFKTYSTQHPDGRAHGGSAIIVNEKIRHFEIEKFETDYLQATNIVIKEINGTSITISAAYCPPRHKITEAQYLEYFKILGTRFIAGGDLNAKHTWWGSRLANPKGNTLYKLMQSNNLEPISSGKPTYWPTDPNKVPDLLDFFITKGISSNYIQCDTSLDLSSDHSPIILTISSNVITQKKGRLSLTNKHTNWETFRDHLKQKTKVNTILGTKENIEDAVEEVINLIHEAAQIATPEIQHRDAQNIVNYPRYIREKVLEKRRARKTWQLSRHKDDKKILNQRTSELNKLLKKIKDDNFQEHLSNLSPYADHDYSLWKATKYMKRPKQSIPPIKKSDGTWAREEQEKAEAFAEHLFHVFKPHPTLLPNEYLENINKYLEIPTQVNHNISPFKVQKVTQEIKKLNVKKAPGYDLITPKILKELPRKTIVAITRIFNSMIRIQHFPIQWKFAHITMIHKQGKSANEITGYRPISLLPCLSKVFEKLLIKILQPKVEEKNIVPEHQFGFKCQHSTIEQIHRIVNRIESNLEERKVCAAAFLDVSQAFDRVWHTGLLYKIKKDLPEYYPLFKSYLEDRYFQVNYNGTLSKMYEIEAGVPQGSVLGPELYKIYTADLPCEDNTLTATFADDTAILASHEDPLQASALLQRSLNKVSEWSTKWRIKINEDKSANITFTNKQITCPDVTLNNKILPKTDDIKYLGMHLDKRLTWKKHLLTKRKHLDLKVRKMYWLLGRSSTLSLESKLLLYKTMLVPVWSYGIQLWGCAKSSNINIIQRFQNKTLRVISNAPWYITNESLHKELKINQVKEQIAKHADKYERRLNYHPNPLANNLLNNADETRRLRRKKPHELTSV